jgi:hypothetical protein
MLTEEDLLVSLSKEKKLLDTLQKQSGEFYRSIRNPLYYAIVVLALILLISIVFCMLYFTNPKDNDWLGQLIMGLFILFFLTFRSATFIEVYSARKKFAPLSDLLDFRKSLLKIFIATSLAPMREAYLSQKLLHEISILPASQQKRLIQVFLKKGEKLKSSKGYIIALLGVLMLGAWTGYIGAVISKKGTVEEMTAYLGVFIIVSFCLTLLVSIYKYNLEQILLKKSNDYFLLSDIISLINALNVSPTPAPHAQSVPRL